MNSIRVKHSNIFYDFLANGLLGLDEPPPSNLCPFMRRVLVYICIELVTGLIVLSILISMFAMWFVMGAAGIAELIAALGAAGWLLTIIILLGIGSSYVKEIIFRRCSTTMKARNLVLEWYRAVHNKICPELDFYDDK